MNLLRARIEQAKQLIRCGWMVKSIPAVYAAAWFLDWADHDEQAAMQAHILAAREIANDRVEADPVVRRLRDSEGVGAALARAYRDAAARRLDATSSGRAAA